MINILNAKHVTKCKERDSFPRNALVRNATKPRIFVFMWCHHFPKLQISNPTGVLVSSDKRPYQNLAFFDV